MIIILSKNETAMNFERVIDCDTAGKAFIVSLQISGSVGGRGKIVLSKQERVTSNVNITHGNFRFVFHLFIF